MAEHAVQCDNEFVHSIKTLLWGNTVKKDVFKRWAQGFYFSPDEPTALIQTEGGPCAVIAPVQAFILKELLSQTDISTWKRINLDNCYQLLVRAFVEILKQAVDAKAPKFSVVFTDCKFSNEESGKRGKWMECVSEISHDGRQIRVGNIAEQDKSKEILPTEMNEECKSIDYDFFHSQLSTLRVYFLQTHVWEELSSSLDVLLQIMIRMINRRITNHGWVNVHMLFTTNTSEQVEEFLSERVDMFKDTYGVLLLLYSAVVTKGVAEIRSEMSDPLESMIDSTYGYGNQSLINLMLTGQAVSHVWDHDQDVGGLKLRGIDKQNPVGFLALLEHLCYCEVGSFLKSPSHPIWVLGSETHLSVLFSTEPRLVSPETPADQAKRVFRKFDPEGNNFISANSLQDVLAELGLVTDADYVSVMRKKLDNENLGIILRASFMDEFFPEEPRTCPDTFPLYHYNGLQHSNPENKVTYHKGQAVLLECTIKGIMESNPMLTVLQTKWPRIEIQWDIGQNPSLN